MTRAAVMPRTISYPVAFGHWSVRQDTLVCRLPRKTLTVTAPAALLDAVFELCDGRLPWSDVARELGRTWKPDSIDAFLAHLCAEGALVEAGEALARWSDIGQVPGVYPRAANSGELPRLSIVARGRLRPGRGATMAGTQRSEVLRELLGQRESCRTFEDAPLTAATLGAIAWAAHGVARPAADPAVGWHRTTASGGNMHSARWFAYVLRELPPEGQDGALQPGAYEARFHVEGGVSFDRVHERWQDAWRVLLDPRVLQFASALLLPVYDIGVPARKYGNRATVFAHVEAGQSLQNAQLMAAAVGAGAMVRGDTSADAARSSLAGALRPGAGSPRPHWLVMPSLVMGAMPQREQVQAQKIDATFAVSAGAGDGEQRFAFVVGPTDGDGLPGLGRSPDPRLALRKAQAEAWERLGWQTLGPVVRATQAEIGAALHPEAFVAYADHQYGAKDFPLRPFSPRRRYLWREGVAAETGRAVHLPAECVHALGALPAWARRQACTNASTSGVAAWTDAEGALCRATLELLERDAFLRAWLAGRGAPLLATASLPLAARRRVAALRQGGHRVAVAQVGTGWVPVYSVFVQAGERPFTAITAAADFDAEAALAKALDEAEGRAAHAAAFPARPLASASEVLSMAQANRYYQSPRFFRRSDFYAEGPEALRFGRDTAGCCADWAALKSALVRAGHELLAFDLTPPGAALDQGRTPLHVIRAFVGGLVPIWFQYGMEPAGLPAFREAAARVKRRGPSSFIHPFT